VAGRFVGVHCLVMTACGSLMVMCRGLVSLDGVGSSFGDLRQDLLGVLLPR
jgi:hypothetical protein